MFGNKKWAVGGESVEVAMCVEREGFIQVIISSYIENENLAETGEPLPVRTGRSNVCQNKPFSNIYLPS